jgi:tetratricopeptide (TPR) repeat protein
MNNQNNVLEECRRLDSEGKSDASIALLTDCIAHSPSGVLYYERGQRFEESGQYDLAKNNYTQAIQMEPLAKYFIARGLLLSSRLSDHESALHDLQQALIIDPQEPNIYSNLALCNLLMGKLRDALDNATLAVQLAPNDHVAHLCLGQCLLAAKQPNDAIAELKISTSLWPASANTWGVLARALSQANRFDEARACIEKAIELERSQNDLIHYATVLLQLKEPLPAITVLREVQKLQMTEAQRYLVEGYLEIANRMLQ